jgi:hypothetical protein
MNFVPYVNPELCFAIDLPENWIYEESDGEDEEFTGFDFYDPQAQESDPDFAEFLNIEIYQEDAAEDVSEITLDNIYQEFKDSIDWGGDYQLINEETLEIGGRNAKRISIKLEEPSINDINKKEIFLQNVYFLLDEIYVYQLITTSRAEKQALYEPIFEKMIGSFVILEDTENQDM